MNWLLISWAIIATVAAIMFLFAGFRQLKVIDEYKELVSDLKVQFTIALDTMRKSDIIGAFEVSDEVGVAFKAISAAVEQLGGTIEQV